MQLRVIFFSSFSFNSTMTMFKRLVSIYLFIWLFIFICSHHVHIVMFLPLYIGNVFSPLLACRRRSLQIRWVVFNAVTTWIHCKFNQKTTKIRFKYSIWVKAEQIRSIKIKRNWEREREHPRVETRCSNVKQIKRGEDKKQCFVCISNKNK